MIEEDNTGSNEFTFQTFKAKQKQIKKVLELKSRNSEKKIIAKLI